MVEFRKEDLPGGECAVLAQDLLQFSGVGDFGGEGMGGDAGGVHWHSVERGHNAGWRVSFMENLLACFCVGLREREGGE